jgi:hypothetical protein
LGVPLIMVPDTWGGIDGVRGEGKGGDGVIEGGCGRRGHKRRGRGGCEMSDDPNNIAITFE